MTLEIDQLVRIIFNGRRQTGCLDLEAIEMVVRSAMHHAGAAALSKLLQFHAIVFLGDEFAMPRQQRLRRHGWTGNRHTAIIQAPGMLASGRLVRMEPRGAAWGWRGVWPGFVGENANALLL